jgi:hypothetical protein
MLTPDQRRALIAQIRQFPSQLEQVIRGLTDEQLTTHYLDGEWTVAQNVHHVADSHMNAYIRTHLLLTEENPTIRPYFQERWAELPDSTPPSLDDSLEILRGLHHRWARLFEGLSEEQWARPGLHPDNGPITVESILQSYVEHGAGHIDQIQRTLAAGK